MRFLIFFERIPMDLSGIFFVVVVILVVLVI